MALTQNLTPTHYGAASGATIGLALWALGTFAFKTGVPDAVTLAVYVLLPGIVTGAAGFFTRKGAKEPAAPVK